MTPTDQTIKVRLVALVAAFGLAGFFLEIGPVAGAFPQVAIGLRLELSSFGFLAYLALAAAAVVTLRLSETEPTPKVEQPSSPPLPATSEGGEVREYARVRPDLQQLRSLLTALGGFTVLKGISLVFLWQAALQSNSYPARALQFGLAYVGLGWFILIQFLRWYARRRRWIRLHDELMGVDISRVVAVVIMLKPLFFLAVAIYAGLRPAGLLYQVAPVLLHLGLATAAVLLWLARPLALRRTVVGLAFVGGGIVLLTVVQAVLERVLPAIYG